MPELSTIVCPWIPICTVLSTGDEPTALDANERTYSAALAAIAANVSGDGKITVFRLSKCIQTKDNAVRFRAIGITADQVLTFDVMSGVLGDNSNCSLSLLGTLSFTIGTQLSDTALYYLADTLTITAGDSCSIWSSKSLADNRIAEAMIDLMGDDVLVIVPTTVGCNGKLLAKFY